MTTRPARPALLLLAAALSAIGCDTGQTAPAAPAGEPVAVGRTGTVEYRPALAAGGTAITKQRVGVIRKLSADWVVVDEQGNEVWVPRDMVLEIRMDRK